ncbi:MULTISPECIES: S10 family peptidase [Kordiimonas]|jgi:carboxypeptidase C (cathepsin A)|uniref:S10 family peptidase n=1 Tax=Kordiimonas TaxID=288021 RepID=UPI00257DD90A|nr:peptidase S10 [Kordiimonas sp. UBA4487]
MFKLAKSCVGMLLAASMTLPAVAAETKDETAVPVEAPKVYEVEKTGTFGGEKVKYKAIAGETHLKNDKGEATASIFSTTYLRTDLKSNAERPVFFIFNGGPGSASLWLHLGVYGPKRVVLPSDAEDDGAAPYRLEDNPLSILDMADMVFIDPVGTGYSRAIGKGDGKDFWGIENDAQSIAEFIRLWLVKHKRWNSPKYLSGESYGTTRAAALLHELQGGWSDIAINGVVFISSILDFQTARYQPGNDTPYISYLPTMAATAWYHGKVDKAGRTLEGFIDEVRAFTLGDYASALLQGNRLGETEFNAVAAKLAAYTGLSEQYVKNANLRVNNMRFMKELLRNEGKTVGRLDSRFVGEDYEGTGDTFDNDPSGYGIDAAYTAGIYQYMQNDLGVDIERRYEVLSGTPGRHWAEPRKRGYSEGYPNVAPYVGTAMRENKDLRTMVANGYYDLATPFFASENTFNANGIDTSRVWFTYYEAGHMMYVHQPSIEQLVKDIRTFIQGE